MEAEFVPGTTLARRYYLEVVRPLIDGYAPGLRHSAALIGWGSDVLGFDTPRSTDHNWGPRCQIFLGAGDGDRAAEITALLADRLPAAFLGWPTRFPDATAPDPAPRHWVEVADLGHWLISRLGFDPRAGVGLIDWLATPAQALAELTGGEVFSDGLAPGDGAANPGGLGAARTAMAWYPDDVWRYVLACQWQRISQEEAFPGRCTEVGDELGSVVVTARLARDLMRLALLMHRRYPLYGKWLGSAFARLAGADRGLHACLTAVLAAPDWPGREQNLCAAYEAVAVMHNDLGLTRPVEAFVRPFHDRPFRVIDTGRFVAALVDSISAVQIRRLPMTGAADQFIDSTDACADVPLLRSIIGAQVRGYPQLQRSPGQLSPATDWRCPRTRRRAMLSAMTFKLPEDLDRLAQVQRGILTADQAQRGGLSAASVRSCLQTGRWQPLHRGVYATFTGEPTRGAILWAAVLRAGRGALLSYFTAAELHGLIDRPIGAIHVTIPDRVHPCLVADQVYRALYLAGPVTARPCSAVCPVTRGREA